ncbi:MAG: TerC family protein [Pirellulales bacterium]|nr:TerC family protein [Pirellulales bacterium]
MAELLTVDNAIALVTLTVMEIVLGIDNVVFIAILSGKLPKEQQPKARSVGLALAMLMRIALLFAISWIMSLKATLFTVSATEVSWKDLILITGGVFLIGKATWEIHHQINHNEALKDGSSRKQISFASVISQVILLDLVFSIDSVLTAVGMVDQGDGPTDGGIWIMVTAVIASVLTMMFFAGPIARFIERHSTVKMLALSFLILIGVMLVVEGSSDTHIDKGYVYFAMGFSVFVELLQMRFRSKRGLPTAKGEKS